MKKITRKDIRRPDQFVTLAGKSFHLFRQHKTSFLVSVALIISVLLALWGWDLYRGRQNHLAAQEYSRALTLYHDGKYREALDALAHVSIYRSSPYSRLGLLYQSHSHVALQETAKAIATLQQLLNRERKEPFLRQLAFVTLAYAQERTGQCPEATRSFTEAQKLPGPFKEEAILGKARCFAQSQDFKAALNSYRQYLTDYPASERISEIALRVQELEAKVQGGAGATN